MKGMTQRVADLLLKWQNDTADVFDKDALLEAVAMTKANGYDKELRGKTIYRGFNVARKHHAYFVKRFIRGDIRMRVKRQTFRPVESWTRDPLAVPGFLMPSTKKLGVCLSRTVEADDSIVFHLSSRKFKRDVDSNPVPLRAELSDSLARYHKEYEVVRFVTRAHETYDERDMEFVHVLFDNAVAEVVEDALADGWYMSRENKDNLSFLVNPMTRTRYIGKLNIIDRHDREIRLDVVGHLKVM